MDDFTFQDFPATVKKTSSSRRKLIIIVVVLLLIGAVLIGGGAYLNSQSQEEAFPSPTPFTLQTATEATNTPTPDASPSPSVSPSATTPTPNDEEIDLTVDVLNGSGEAGVAKEAADLLTDAGYTIGRTGNADSFEYEDVVIQIKASKNTLLPALRSTLAKSYTIGSTSANLSPSQTADAVVIIGNE